jgi:hypothetical protein
VLVLVLVRFVLVLVLVRLVLVLALVVVLVCFSGGTRVRANSRH